MADGAERVDLIVTLELQDAEPTTLDDEGMDLPSCLQTGEQEEYVNLEDPVAGLVPFLGIPGEWGGTEERLAAAAASATTTAASSSCSAAAKPKAKSKPKSAKDDDVDYMA